MRTRAFLLVGAIGIPFVVASAGPARAQDTGTNAALQKAVHFALQCNATLGTIEDVAITGTSPDRNGLRAVRGTYRQRVGGFSGFHVHSVDSLGGVFEGDYDLAARKFRAIQFKISLRTGYVAETCLR